MVAWRSDRLLTLGGLAGAVTLSWLYLLRAHVPHDGSGMLAVGMPGMTGSSFEHFLAAFFLWTVMMVAMMLPTAAPAIDLFGTFARKRMTVIGRAPPTTLFVLGYAAVWAAYSLVAATGQVMLSRSEILQSTSRSGSPLLSATLLLLAGAFQFSTLKEACLTQCRSPIPFFLANWRDGNLGAFILGARHGSYCLGCCVALMGLMFVFGTMNLLWMGALSLFMLSEKIAPVNWHLGKAAGVLCILWGTVVAAQLLH